MFRVNLIFDDGTFTNSVVTEATKEQMFRNFATKYGEKYTLDWRKDEILALDGAEFIISIIAAPFR